MFYYYRFLIAFWLVGLTCGPTYAAFCDVPKVCIIQTLRNLKEQCQGEPRRLHQVSANQTKGCPKHFTLTYTDYEGQESRNITGEVTKLKTCGKPRQVVARYECPPKNAIKKAPDTEVGGSASSLDGKTITYRYDECAGGPCVLISGRIVISGDQIILTSNNQTFQMKIGSQFLDTSSKNETNQYRTRTDFSIIANVSGNRITLNEDSKWVSYFLGRLSSEGTSKGKIAFDVTGSTCRISSAAIAHQTNYKPGRIRRQIL